MRMVRSIEWVECPNGVGDEMCSPELAGMCPKGYFCRKVPIDNRVNPRDVEEMRRVGLERVDVYSILPPTSNTSRQIR